MPSKHFSKAGLEYRACAFNVSMNKCVFLMCTHKRHRTLPLDRILRQALKMQHVYLRLKRMFGLESEASSFNASLSFTHSLSLFLVLSLSYLFPSLFRSLRIPDEKPWRIRLFAKYLNHLLKQMYLCSFLKC